MPPLRHTEPPFVLRAAAKGLVVGYLGFLALTVGLRSAEAQPAVRTALPGTVEVPAPWLSEAGASLAAGAGYGWTESVPLAADRVPGRSPAPGESVVSWGPHHRLFGWLAAAYRPAHWPAALALRLDGRYDVHPRDVAGRDDGWTGVPTLRLRGTTALAPQWHLGAELRWTVPGWRAPSFRVEASVLEGLLLGGWRSGPAALWLAAGYRWDRSARSVPDPQALRPGDLVALGSSSFDAVRLGAGGAFTLGSLHLWAAWDWSPLVGSGAPGAMRSPGGIQLGASWAWTASWSLQAGLRIAWTARPVVDASPLVPIEPRLAVWLGLHGRPFAQVRGAPRRSRDEGLRDATRTAEASRGTRPARAEAPPLRLKVLLPDGQPAAGVEVRLQDDAGRQLARERTDAQGEVRFRRAADWPEPVWAVVQPEGYQPARLAVRSQGGEPATLRLQPARGELRGLVRSIRGDPLPNARIVVEPGGHRPDVDAEGRFRLELLPGSYQVRIGAPGYREQRRQVEISEREVTILNVELRPRRGRRR